MGNRVRNNGRRAAPAVSGGGEGVHLTSLSLTDENADWPPDGHRGKTLTVGGQRAVVTFNTSTQLGLAPMRPGAGTAWTDGTPDARSTYRLPDSSGPRAGITIAAAVTGAQLSDNRAWDDQRPGTQTHGFLITAGGRWTECRDL